MSRQIAVRLPDEHVVYIDSQVAAGRASSRADLITKLVAAFDLDYLPSA